ncbi:MAG: hypothetical protein Q3995_04260 [Eubacteriales bacterium]|nr:hypothetical protein [Eubacteriales bacterium]
MKRFVFLFVACLLALSLAACGADTTPTAPDDSSADAPEGLTLDALRVEFVIGERDTDALMALQKELPPLLIDALAQWGCTVGKISVTFGASAEATVQALQNGSIDVAFLPSEVYAACGNALRVAAAQIPAPEMQLETVFLLLTESDVSRAIKEKDYAATYVNAHAGELVWLLPTGDEAAARCANQWLTYTCNLSLEDVIVRYYADAATLAPNAGDILVLRGTDGDITVDDWIIGSCALEGECVAVNAADRITGSDEFVFALKSALFSLSGDNPEGNAALAHYATVGSYVGYTPTYDAAYDAMRYALGYLDQVP